MADSIKFTGHYIDCTGIWDSTLSKNQNEVNASKLNISSIENNLVTTTSGKALDARQGPYLFPRAGFSLSGTVLTITNV